MLKAPYDRIELTKHPGRIAVSCVYKLYRMHSKAFNYYAAYETELLPDRKQLITYSFNDIETSITGILLEKNNRIYLYEYRGKYIGNEFFISFSKESISYKLIKVEDAEIRV